MKKTFILLMVICLCLTGCSKRDPNETITCQFDGSSFKVNGKEYSLTKYEGSYAEWIDDTIQMQISLEQVDDLAYAQFNYFQITTDDMDLYKDKAYCWSMYGSTQQVMYYPYFEAKDGSKYWIAMTAWGVSYMQAQVYMWDLAEELVMSEQPILIDCGDFVFGNEYSYPKVTNNWASITGTVKVSKQQDPNCTEPFTLVYGEEQDKTVSMTKYDSDTYSYYQYGDWLIQTVFGIDLNEYLTFK